MIKLFSLIKILKAAIALLLPGLLALCKDNKPDKNNGHQILLKDLQLLVTLPNPRLKRLSRSRLIFELTQLLTFDRLL